MKSGKESNPINRRNALERLEAVRPDSDGLLDPSFTDDARAIRADSELKEQFHKCQLVDG